MAAITNKNSGTHSRLSGVRDRYIYLGGGALFLAASFIMVRIWGPEMEFPINVGRSVALRVDNVIDWVVINMDFILGPISDTIKRFLVKLKDFLQWVPWPVFIVSVTAVSYKIAGRGVAIFAFVSLLLVGAFGLWESAMITMSLITVAVLISIAIAIPIGILATRSDTMDALLRPILDAMQTMPAFVYLVPAIMFFGLGNVSGVLATVIYAVPPAIRLTNLGIRQVNAEVVEAAQSFGTTPRQLLLKVQIPMAVPTIMAGINQTTMMALAMVVIASLVGAGGLGDDVNRALSQFQPGKALNGGMGIVALAIIIDRVTQAAAKERQEALVGSGK